MAVSDLQFSFPVFRVGVFLSFSLQVIDVNIHYTVAIGNHLELPAELKYSPIHGVCVCVCVCV